MTVTCRIVNCPYNNESICSAKTILINHEGRCFDLIKGFRPEESEIIKSTNKIYIEDVETQEHEPKPDILDQIDIEENKEEEVKTDDNGGCYEGT